MARLHDSYFLIITYYQKIRVIQLFRNHKLILKGNKLEVLLKLLLKEDMVVKIPAIRS
jgi:hypothetical protein